MSEEEAMLCELCSRLEKGSIGKGYIEANPRLRAWWEEHKKKDEREKILLQLEQLEKRIRGAN